MNLHTRIGHYVSHLPPDSDHISSLHRKVKANNCRIEGSYLEKCVRSIVSQGTTVKEYGFNCLIHCAINETFHFGESQMQMAIVALVTQFSVVSNVPLRPKM